MLGIVIVLLYVVSLPVGKKKIKSFVRNVIWNSVEKSRVVR